VDRFSEYLDANVDRMKQPIPFSNLPISGMGGGMTDEGEPEPVNLLPAGAERGDEDNSLGLALSLSNHPDLISLQRQVKALVARQGIPVVEWNAPDGFHITLCYAPDVTPEQVGRALVAIHDIPVPALELGIGSLATFDGVGKYPL